MVIRHDDRCTDHEASLHRVGPTYSSGQGYLYQYNRSSTYRNSISFIVFPIAYEENKNLYNVYEYVRNGQFINESIERQWSKPRVLCDVWAIHSETLSQSKWYRRTKETPQQYNSCLACVRPWILPTRLQFFLKLRWINWNKPPL